MIQPWKKIAERPYKAGYRTMLKRTFELPDGRITNYDIVDNKGCAAVVALIF
ncbi:MAG: hypothetical protein M3Q64_03205 [bacterium]|nr:hypothetical protein [bacterium]